MRPVGVVTDSAACLPPDLVEALEIEVIPFSLVWQGRVLRDGWTLRPKRSTADSPMPTACPSQPSPGEFLEVYQCLARGGRAILSIHVPARSCT